MPVPMSRRDMLASASTGFGLMSLSALMADQSYAGLAKSPSRFHFPPKCKRVVFLFMPGGVSHVDSFDPKPALKKHHGKSIGNWSNSKSMGANPGRVWKESPWKFQKYGQAGIPVSSLFPNIATCVDYLGIIRSMVAEVPLHAGGNLFLHSGRLRAGSPSLGSWITYGLGSESQSLPGYVLLNSGTVPPGGKENFANGYLPASFQATSIKAEGVPVDNIVPARSKKQRDKLRWLIEQDSDFAQRLGDHTGIESAIRNYEMAYRMQTAVPDTLDLSQETKETKKLYGLDARDKDLRSYGTQCLRARRLLEAGVRFVEITANPVGHLNGSWDQHGNLKRDHEKNALVTDQPIAALIKDLKQRDLFDETLILCAGEMGRTPHAGSAASDGRDHHTSGFSVWMAGGGIKGGTIYGATDEFGMESVENVVTVFDLHATILHLLGLDHERLTFRYGGRDMRLTDVHGHVVKEILA
ncbi:MAG: sulfatase [Planctomycetaceae bacterium]|nr:sulfatase [Planctomycetaceae bacterium]